MYKEGKEKWKEEGQEGVMDARGRRKRGREERAEHGRREGMVKIQMNKVAALGRGNGREKVRI